MRIWCILIALGLCWPALVWGQMKPEEVERSLASAVKTEQSAHKEAQKWAGQRADLLQEISQLKRRLRWVDHQRQRYENYVRRQKEAIAELERRQRELQRINRELEPYLDEVVDRLTAFIRHDLEFLAPERARRIAFLNRSLNDHRLDLSEKLRRVMEALRVEASYGRGVEKTEGEVDINGQKTQVDLLRLGRLALYYATPDRQRLGWRPRAAAEWRELAPQYRRQLMAALEMAQRQRAVELITLPVGRPAR